jgi:hypothetical protein
MQDLTLSSVVRIEEFLANGLEVKPFVGRTLHSSVIQIEAVNVDDGTHSATRKKQGAPKSPRALGRNHRGSSQLNYMCSPRIGQTVLYSCFW